MPAAALLGMLATMDDDLIMWFTKYPVSKHSICSRRGVGTVMKRSAQWSLSLDDYHLGGHPDNFDFYNEFDLADLNNIAAEQANKLSTLAMRAKKADLLHAIGIGFKQHLALVLQFPAGEATRNLFVDSSCVEEVLASSFEEFEYLHNYDAIWSARLSSLEALVEYDRTGMLAHYKSRDGQARMLEVRADHGAIVRIGFPSANAIALMNTHYMDSVRLLTVSISGLRLSTRDEAEHVLETIGSSFLLQVEEVIGDLPHLVTRHRRPWKLDSESEIRIRGASETTLVYPHPPLRSEPAKMYFYAQRIPRKLPVVRFLAFYNVIEYFFLIYARIQVVEHLQEILQTPGFSPNSARDVGKLISAVPKGGYQGLGSELPQLEAALRRCVDIEAFRSFIAKHRNHPVMVTLMSHEQPLGVKRLRVEHHCGSDSPAVCLCDEALVKSLAERVYTLRNRIVHSKETSNEASRQLLPFMPQADYLDADIELVRYLARKVLTAPESTDLQSVLL